LPSSTDARSAISTSLDKNPQTAGLALGYPPQYSQNRKVLT